MDVKCEGVLDLLFFPEYTQSACNAQHTTYYENHPSLLNIGSTILEELEYLEGHSLHSLPLPAYDMYLLFDTRYQQEMGFSLSYLYID